MRLVSADREWRVDVIELTGTSNHNDGQWLRITHLGWFAGQVRTPAEIEHFVPLADLEEVSR
jgi:hypothetical protein